MSAGESLRRLRERKPLVHQITNYVVMNETANATLALGALPVMAHAREEVEEMVGLAGALVLNIGTLSPHWVEAMLAAGRAANERGVPVVLDPVGAGATRYRTETAQADPRRGRRRGAARQRRRGGDARRRRGRGARRRVDRRRRRPGRARPRGRAVARRRRVGDRRRSTTSPTASGVPRSRTAIRCSRRSPAPAACRARSPAASSRSPSRRSTARSRRSSPSASPARTPRVDAKGPGSFHVDLYDALAALDPATLDGRARVA